MKVNDKKIINYIKYLPFYFLILTTIIFTIYIIIDNYIKTENEKNKLKSEYTLKYNESVKNETLKVIDFVNAQINRNQNDLIKVLREKNSTAYHIVNSIYQNNKTKSKEEIIEHIKIALGNIRFFEGRGYYYILGLDDGFCHFHPVFKELENKSLIEVQDANGLYLTKEMLKIMKTNDEGYLSYYWYKKGIKDKQFEKVAYLSKFEPLGIYIVSSDYLDSLMDRWKNEVTIFLDSVNFKDENSYFIIDKKTGKYVYHKRREFIGKHISDAGYIQNSKDLSTNIKNFKEGSLHTYKVKLENDQIINKTSYIQVIDKWDWIVGIGYYDQSINEILENENEKLDEIHFNNLLTTLIFLIIISVVVLLISRYFSKIIERRFKVYNFSINRKIVEIARQQRILAQQSKMVAMGEMIENIAHQWRQPLSIISTCSTGLKINKEYGNLTDDIFESNINSINNSAQYLSQTIDDFRNFYKRSNLEKSFRVDELIEKSLQLLKVEIDSLKVKIDKDFKKIELYGYENELLQVVLNLINNSLYQFSNSNLVENALIRINIEKENNEIKISFIDNGGGISPSIIDRIFEPYFTTKDKTIGTGIGLYMSKNIIEKHFDGTLHVKNVLINEDNKNYKGAKFIIRIKHK